MEIDADVVKVFRTYLEEVWPKAAVTDEMVRENIEMILMCSIVTELDKYPLPRTTGAVYDYYGIDIDDPTMEDEDAQEVREDEIEVEDSSHAEEDA